jgi:type II secretory pathway component GspD/PulD (secretin)
MIACVIPMAGISQSGEQNNSFIVQSESNTVSSGDQQIHDKRDLSKRVIQYKIQVVEADVDKKIDFGSDSNGSPGNAAQFNILRVDTYKPLIRKIQSELNGKIISTPQILVENGKAAELRTGEVEKGELSIKITPEIIEDNNVQQDITVAVKKTDEELNGAFRQKSFETKLIVKEGSTFVIGGIPGKDVGITGGNNRELCIFVTPHIINSPESQANDTGVEKEQVKRFAESEQGL